jgi:16S rRNA (cytosine1402-N4)-methyltransferase
LGVSSHQINEGERGFSFRFEDAVPDMRMNRQQKLSALQILNESTESELGIIFRNYGELKAPFVAAKAIVQYRQSRPVGTIADIVNALGNFLKPKTRNKQLAQIFQAIRIEVNQEMETLYDFLRQSADLLKPGGRLVIMSYHSLEDRMVKNFINSGHVDGEVSKDFFGNKNTPFKAITKKPIIPSDEEIAINKRARSAKLRIAEKL